MKIKYLLTFITLFAMFSQSLRAEIMAETRWYKLEASNGKFISNLGSTTNGSYMTLTDSGVEDDGIYWTFKQLTGGYWMIVSANVPKQAADCGGTPVARMSQWEITGSNVNQEFIMEAVDSKEDT